MRSRFAHILSEAPSEIIRRTRAGIPVAAIHEVAIILEISDHRLCKALRIRRPKLNQGKSPAGILTIDGGDRLLRVLKVFERASDVLGGQDSGRQWLCRAVRSLGGVQPLSLLDTGVGYRCVMDALGRIEHGFAA